VFWFFMSVRHNPWTSFSDDLQQMTSAEAQLPHLQGSSAASHPSPLEGISDRATWTTLTGYPCVVQELLGCNPQPMKCQ
jgi:hypothetical protein